MLSLDITSKTCQGTSTISRSTCFSMRLKKLLTFISSPPGRMMRRSGSVMYWTGSSHNRAPILFFLPTGDSSALHLRLQTEYNHALRKPVCVEKRGYVWTCQHSD